MLARLAAELRADRSGLALRIADATEARRRLTATAGDVAAVALAAYALHGHYTGLETMFERIARELDGSLPVGDRWHRELLAQMSTAIPRVRPAVIAPDTVDELAALLAFRHFFRHAYAATLDPVRVGGELARLLAVAPRIDAHLAEFARFLDDALDAASRDA